MNEERAWVDEQWNNVQILYKVRSILYENRSEFQHTQIVDSYQYGRMLLLDGFVQTTEKDEFIYHEMMVHVPMLSHPNPEKVLIIGGGDGGILREVLRYGSVGGVTMVEIDSKVIDLCQEYLPMISAGAFNDKRTNLVIDDGAEFVKETKDQFDVIIVDSPDPIGPARVLFSKSFYLTLHDIMTNHGILARQTGSLHLQVDEQKEAYDLLTGIYSYTEPFVFAVPTYVGGFFSAMFSSDSINPLDIGISALEDRVVGNRLETKYYHPGIHVGAFHVPRFLKERLICQ
ncbi:MAG: polyamine aminopropyltransferase [Deltaproteobacteria bacterium]|nr:polyamine aminopropyltransferase [Deltaproteobacteria bacterium]